VRDHSLDRLRELIRARTVEQPSLKHPALGYVRYQRPPVVEPVETLVLESGERLQGEIKYYDYGVLSLVFELAFTDGWSKLTRLASRWMWDVDFAAQATEIVRGRLKRAAPALMKPYKEWLSEDYLIFHIWVIIENKGYEIGNSSAARQSRRRNPQVDSLCLGVGCFTPSIRPCSVAAAPSISKCRYCPALLSAERTPQRWTFSKSP
jgi:hypothetical protein